MGCAMRYKPKDAQQPERLEPLFLLWADVCGPKVSSETCYAVFHRSTLAMEQAVPSLASCLPRCYVGVRFVWQYFPIYINFECLR